MRALTVGEMSRRLGCPVHRVEYLIRSREMSPSHWAGNARVFTESQFRRIRCLLKKTEAIR